MRFSGALMILSVFVGCQTQPPAAPVDKAAIVGELTTAQHAYAQAWSNKDMEAISGKMVSDGFFSQPVTYENPDIATVQVECRIATGAQARIRIGTFIIEPMQNTVV